MLTRPDGYVRDDSGKWTDISDISGKNADKNKDALTAQLEKKGVKLKVVGILRPSAEAVASSMGGSVAYTSALTREYIKLSDASEVIAAQEADKDTDILTGIPFSRNEDAEITVDDVKAYRHAARGSARTA